MAFRIPKETYKSSVNEVVLGKNGGRLRIGGANVPAFHLFEGECPNPSAYCLEVIDMEPSDWPDALADFFGDVWASPVRWAQKAASEYGAEAVCLRLASTDPVEKDSPPEQAAALVKEVAGAIDVPLIVYATGSEAKDAAVLCEVARACPGMNLTLGPLLKSNFQEIGEAALANGHAVIIQTALEIPEAKEVNVKLTKNFPPERVLYDPISPALGYGMEYGYSVMERMKLAACSFGDKNLSMPLVANIGKECWETKEAKEKPQMGLLWEAMTAMTFLVAGADLLIVRHPRVKAELERLIAQTPPA